MHVEATRILTAWLKDTTYGVNALLANVPRKKMTTGSDPKPPIVDVYNDVDFEIMKDSGIDPPTMPSLVVVSEVTSVTEDFLKSKMDSGHWMRGAAGIAYYTEQSEKSLDIIAGNYVM